MTHLWRKTPLAWLQLVKQKSRIAVALAGIAFADILMFVQMGLLDSLYDSATQPHRNLRADLVVLNPQSKTLIDLLSFSRRRLYQAKGHEDVVAVNSLYVGMAPWRNPQTRVNRSILIFGLDPLRSPFTFVSEQQQLKPLTLLNRGLFDRASRPEYGPISQLIGQEGVVNTEVNDKRFKAVGLFNLGASFGADGNVITSHSTFLTLFPERPSEHIDIGLIQLAPSAIATVVQAELRSQLPDDVSILTKAEFIQLETTYWADGGTGFIFNLGTVVGFIVGTVIVYQILYTDVSDHLPEYATLKAIGYDDRYLIGVLVQEVLVLAVLGFIPGFIASFGLYKLTYAATALPVVMKTTRAVIVFVLTIVMCSASGLIAMQKLRAADPADVFA